MTDSLPPHRSEFEALKTSIDERFAEQNMMILSHNDAATRRSGRQEKTIEAMRDSLQTVADQLSAMVKDYSDTKRAMQKQDLDHAEEKGAILAKMAQQERTIHERLNQQDLGSVQLNGEIAKINAKLQEIIPVVIDFKEAARIILDDQKDRKRAEERNAKAMGKIETYSKAVIAIAAIAGIISATLAYLSNHIQLKDPPHESASPKSSRVKKVHHYEPRRRYAWDLRGDGQNAGVSVFLVSRASDGIIGCVDCS